MGLGFFDMKHNKKNSDHTLFPLGVHLKEFLSITLYYAKLFLFDFIECPSNLLTIFSSLLNYRVPADQEHLSYSDKINA